MPTSPSPSPLSVLLIGDSSRGEFAAAIAFTESAAQVVRCPNIEAALHCLKSAVESPELIVLAQRWPGEFAEGDIDRLQRAAPLARISGLLGSWCEGEARSGHPWPAMTRIEAAAWSARLGQDCERLLCGENPSWTLPVTTRDDERLLHASETPPSPRTGLIAVVAERDSTAGAIADACRLRGYATVSLRLDRVAGISGALGAVWDTTSELAGNSSVVGRLRIALGNIPVVALLDFPRVQHIVAARAAGVAAVLAKPYLIDDLYWHLDQLTD